MSQVVAARKVLAITHPFPSTQEASECSPGAQSGELLIVCLSADTYTAILCLLIRNVLLCRLGGVSRFHDKLMPRPFTARLRSRLPNPSLQFCLQQCQLIRTEFIHPADTRAWRVFKPLPYGLHRPFPSRQPDPPPLALIQAQSDVLTLADVVVPRVPVGAA